MFRDAFDFYWDAQLATLRRLKKKREEEKKERKYVLKDDFVIYFSDTFKSNSSKSKSSRNAKQLSECHETLRITG